MKNGSFRDLVWYRNGLRANARATMLARKSADSFVIVYDVRAAMFGVGPGDKRPEWAKDSDGFRFIRKVGPSVC